MSTPAQKALRPCPFCGNSDGLEIDNEHPTDLSGGYFIACPKCGASTGLRYACGDDPRPLLVEQWNRRAALTRDEPDAVDARRWRWWRENSQEQWRNGPGLYWYLPYRMPGTKEEKIDAYVDAALARDKLGMKKEG